MAKKTDKYVSLSKQRMSHLDDERQSRCKDQVIVHAVRRQSIVDHSGVFAKRHLCKCDYVARLLTPVFTKSIKMVLLK